MLVKNLLTHLARLVNHKRQGVYAKVMGINQLNKLSSEMNIIRMNAGEVKTVTKTSNKNAKFVQKSNRSFVESIRLEFFRPWTFLKKARI